MQQPGVPADTEHTGNTKSTLKDGAGSAVGKSCEQAEAVGDAFAAGLSRLAAMSGWWLGDTTKYRNKSPSAVMLSASEPSKTWHKARMSEGTAFWAAGLLVVAE